MLTYNIVGEKINYSLYSYLFLNYNKNKINWSN